MARSTISAAVTVALITGIAAASAAVAAPAPGHGHGHGALKSILVPTQPSAMSSQCQAATTGAPQGFAVLSAPGKPGSAPTRVVGTVSLKKAPQHNATFSVQIATSGTCTDTGAKVTTNGVGNGTARFDFKPPAGSTATSYYVVLTQTVASALPALPATVREYYASQALALS